MDRRLCIECFRELEEFDIFVCEFCDTDEFDLDPWRDWDEVVIDEDELIQEVEDEVWP